MQREPSTHIKFVVGTGLVMRSYDLIRMIWRGTLWAGCGDFAPWEYAIA
jgi:hypothetical protein